MLLTRSKPSIGIFSLTSLRSAILSFRGGLKSSHRNVFSVNSMYADNGKFMIYSSDRPSPERLRIVGSAVAKVANALKLETEVSPRSKLLSIYVYYRSHVGEEIPVYCDWGKSWKENDVYRAIKNMMFVLSFHPSHPALRTIRKEVCISA